MFVRLSWILTCLCFHCKKTLPAAECCGNKREYFCLLTRIQWEQIQNGYCSQKQNRPHFLDPPAPKTKSK